MDESDGLFGKTVVTELYPVELPKEIRLELFSEQGFHDMRLRIS